MKCSNSKVCTNELTPEEEENLYGPWAVCWECEKQIGIDLAEINAAIPEHKWWNYDK